jgi:hypothetical protein
VTNAGEHAVEFRSAWWHGEFFAIELSHGEKPFRKVEQRRAKIPGRGTGYYRLEPGQTHATVFTIWFCLADRHSEGLHGINRALCVDQPGEWRIRVVRPSRFRIVKNEGVPAQEFDWAGQAVRAPDSDPAPFRVLEDGDEAVDPKFIEIVGLNLSDDEIIRESSRQKIEPWLQSPSVTTRTLAQWLNVRGLLEDGAWIDKVERDDIQARTKLQELAGVRAFLCEPRAIGTPICFDAQFVEVLHLAVSSNEEAASALLWRIPVAYDPRWAKWFREVLPRE